MPEETEQAKKETQVLVFRLGSEEYGVDIHEVSGIIKKKEITPVPNSPRFVEGIINLRGRIVVVLNLLKRFGNFGKPSQEEKHILISEIGESSFGVLVEEVTEVLKIGEDDIKDAPRIVASKIHADYLKGVGVLGERLIIILKLSKILSEKEIIKMSGIVNEMDAKRSKLTEKVIVENTKSVDTKVKQQSASTTAKEVSS